METGQKQLREITVVSTASKVDRDAGVIHGLVILGPESANGYVYREAAMQKAVSRGLYEGRPCNANHVPDGQNGSVYDRLGVWKNIRMEGGKVKGDFHVNRGHSLCMSLYEAAERPALSGMFGFSHDAFGREEPGSDGKFIGEIEEVVSVDLVSDPATVRSLWEQKIMTTTPVAQPVAKNKPKASNGAKTKNTLLKNLIDGLAPNAPQKKKTALIAWLKEDMSGSSMYGDEPMESTPGASGDDLDASPPAHGAEFFQQICAMIDKMLEGADSKALNPEYLDKLDAIKQICESHGGDDDNNAKGGSGDSDDADGKKDGKKPGKQAPTLRETQAENARLKRELEVRRLCDEAKHTPTPTQLKALAPLSDTEAKALIENFKLAAAPAAPPAAPSPATPPNQTPRSQSPGNVNPPSSKEVTEHKKKTAEEEKKDADEARLQRNRRLTSGRW